MGDIQTPQITLDEIFNYISEADKPCIIAIDEFQQIGEYAEKNVEALLRTKIQQCNRAQFIFAGSKRHMMSNMFNSSSKPFYQRQSVWDSNLSQSQSILSLQSICLRNTANISKEGWQSGWLPSTDKIYVPSKALKKFLAYVSLSNILERTMDAAAIFSRFSGCW